TLQRSRCCWDSEGVYLRGGIVCAKSSRARHMLLRANIRSEQALSRVLANYVLGRNTANKLCSIMGTQSVRLNANAWPKKLRICSGKNAITNSGQVPMTIFTTSEVLPGTIVDVIREPPNADAWKLVLW